MSARNQDSGVPRELLDRVSYRRLDYWCRRGHLHVQREGAGSGVWRQWPTEEVTVALRIADLLEAGWTLAAAAKLARQGRSE